MADLFDSIEQVDPIEPEAAGDDPPPQNDGRFGPLLQVVVTATPKLPGRSAASNKPQK